MSATQSVFALIHGGWLNHSTWDRVTPIPGANDFTVLTLDLPGAGIYAIAPTSLGCCPFDPTAFASERSHFRCTQDRAIPLAAQDHVTATVDDAIGGRTTKHTLESSHSPFLSQPAALPTIHIDIGARFLAKLRAEAQ